jgi:hypothetical protein
MIATAASVRRSARSRNARKSVFTLRDLSRQTAEVIGAADQLGSVQIQARDGRSYLLTATPLGASTAALPDWRARRERICAAAFTTAESADFDKILAGE